MHTLKNEQQLKNERYWNEFIEDGRKSFSVAQHIEKLARESEAIFSGQAVIATRTHEQREAIKLAINEDAEKGSVKKQAENQVADYIEQRVVPMTEGKEKLKFQKLAFAMHECRTKGCIGLRADNTHVIAWDSKCNCGLLCPFESNTETKRLIDKYVPAVTKWLEGGRNRRLFYAVATTPNLPAGQLHEGKRQVFKNWSKLLKRKSMRNVKGALVRQEDPLSAKDDWNIHLNCILLVEGEFNYAQVRKDWGYNIDFQPMRGSIPETVKTFKEVLKYSVQLVSDKSTQKASSGKSHAPALTEWPVDRFLEWFDANGRFRRTRSYGELFRVDTPDTDAEQQIDWIGQISLEGNDYSVRLPFLEVDSTQANNSTFNNYQREQIRPTPPPDIQ